ncbi:hypothetical protein ACIA8K_41100 [Catenuloplanes sp. NPDC051500]|uniref:hypothetical protein n=1 Tax=Catenuloplanes sp. NPDC051500 TaxID=3363959 RepID=UPI0037939D25
MTATTLLAIARLHCGGGSTVSAMWCMYCETWVKPRRFDPKRMCCRRCRLRLARPEWTRGWTL